MSEDADNGSVSEDFPLAINSLSYAYPGSLPVISDLTLNLPRGSRCLLLGANGAGVTTVCLLVCVHIWQSTFSHTFNKCFTGKSTLLQVLAGQHMVGPEVVRILGRPAFHDVVCCDCFSCLMMLNTTTPE